MFVVVVESAKVISGAKVNSPITYEGDRFIVTIDPEHWVEADSQHFNGEIPPHAKIFDTFNEAEKFAKRWGGHPYWCKPNGNYEIIEVQPKFGEPQIIGYIPTGRVI